MHKTKPLCIAITVVLCLGTMSLASEPNGIDEWKTMDIGQLAGLAGQIDVSTDSGRSTMRALARFVADHYEDGLSIAGANQRDWLDLAAPLGAYLPSKMQQELIRQFREVYISNEAAVAGLDAETAGTLAEALSFFHLDSQSDAAFVATNWLLGLDEDETPPPAVAEKIAWALGYARGGQHDIARRKLATIVSREYLASPEKARLVSSWGWWILAMRSPQELAPQEKREWITKLRQSFFGEDDLEFDLPHADRVRIHLALSELDDKTGLRLVHSWMDDSDAWKKMGPEGVSLLAELLSTSGNKADPYMGSLLDYVEAKYLSDVSATRSVSPLQWSRLRYYLAQGLRDTSLKFHTPLAVQLRKAYAGSDGSLDKLCDTEKSLFLKTILNADALEASGLMGQMLEGEAINALSPTVLAHIAQNAGLLGPGWTAQLERIKNYFQTEYLSDSTSARKVPLHAWARMAGSIRLTPGERDRWISMLLTTYAFSADSAGRLRDLDFEEVVAIFRRLAKPNLAMMLQKERWWRNNDHSEIAFLDSKEERGDLAFRLLLIRIVSAPPAEREAMWDKALQDIQSERMLLRRPVLLDVEEAIRKLSSDDPRICELMISDLQNHVGDRQALFELRMRQRELALERIVSSSSEGISELVERASETIEKGNISQSLSIYSKILNEFPEEAEVVPLVAWRVLSLLSELKTDLSLSQKAVEILLNNGKRVNGDLCPFAFDLMCGQLLSASPSQRQDIWEEWVLRFGDDDIWFSEETLSGLDNLKVLWGSDGLPSRDEALTTLLLLVPDVNSMRSINYRRISAFEESNVADEIAAAKRLDAALAFVSRDMSAEVARWYIEDVESPGGVGSFSSVKAAKEVAFADNGQVSLSAESLLSLAAKKVLEEQKTSLTLRRKAFLSMFSGDASGAVARMHEAILRTPAQEEQVVRAFDDLLVCLVYLDGDCQIAISFTQFVAAFMEYPTSGSLLTELLDLEKTSWDTSSEGGSIAEVSDRLYWDIPVPEKRQFGEAVLHRWQERCIELGNHALNRGEELWVSKQWSVAVNSAVSKDCTSQIIDRISARASAHTDGIKALLETEHFLAEVSSRRYLLSMIADIYSSRGDYESCLATLEKMDELGRGSTQVTSMGIEQLRAVALIRLGRLDEAIKSLEANEDIQGTDDQHAKRWYLIASCHLQKGEIALAREALGSLVKAYPQTKVGQKADSMLTRLRGM